MKQRVIPGFVISGKHEAIPKERGQKYLKALSNWLTVHGSIKAMVPSYQNLMTLCDLMFVEYHRKSGARMDIIARLYGKYNRMRMEIERAEL